MIKQKSDEIGEQSELAVEFILADLERKGIIFCFYRTRKGGSLDSDGVDFLIFVEVEEKKGKRKKKKKRRKYFPLQVKSSYERACEFAKRNPQIPVVFVTEKNRKYHNSDLRLRILEIIKKFV